MENTEEQKETVILNGREVSKEELEKQKEAAAAQKGAKLEEAVAAKIKRYLPGCIVLRDIIIPNGERGGSTEIDILALTTKGFYCFECKNYSGLLTGLEGDKKWKIHIGKKFTKELYSPLAQNTRHIECLRAMFPNFYFQNIVVFGDITSLADNLKTSECLMNFSQLDAFLEEVKNLPDIETEATNQMIAEYLSNHQAQTRSEHIKYVQKLKTKEISY